ncbi:MAG TPA: carboxypeptidase-like regulatory domain-containing protein, partial [Candidatus Sulfotelmatobacter sp.]|nr:carboxypeptidase-like regulatory domain-containing protein [Candidatus Sulfotelmatobacter sp.]
MITAAYYQPSNGPGAILRGLLFAILFTIPLTVFGQGYFGTVSGEITDSSGAVVPGVKVTLADQQKGYRFVSSSDNVGRYLFTSVPPGLYSVSAVMPGFEKTVHTGITLNVSENATANLTLKVASTKQAIEVQAQVQNLETEDAVTGQVVNRRFINDLPLVDRYVLDFVELGPGMNNQSDSNSVSDTGTNFISNGSRGANSDILMDGASITNFEPNGGITNVTYTPSADAVEELKVQQTNFSAEYGFTGATVVNMVTRSGTNSFHGSAYDFSRNAITDANNWFNNATQTPIPPVHRQNYGGTIGGPIFKNKTFFFFDWDGTRESTLGTYAAGVPSAAERNGNFGELCAANGGSFDTNGLCSVIAGQIYDPYTGTLQSQANGTGAYRSAYIPYNDLATYTSPGNPNLNGTPYQLTQGAGNLIDPVAQKLMNLFPPANIPGGSIYDNWFASGASTDGGDQFDLKIDHRFSEKNLLSAKYSDGWGGSTPYNCFKNFTDPCGSGPNQSAAHLFAINDTHTFSPTLLLTSTLGFTRGSMLIDAYNKKLNPDPLGTLGFPSYLETNGFVGVPAIFIDPTTYYSAGYTSIGQDPYGNYVQGQDTGQLIEQLTKIKGKHELKFGFEGRLHQQNYIQTNSPLGYFNFNSLGSSQCPSPVTAVCGGDAMASFMMGELMAGSLGSYYEIQFEVAS